MTRPQTYREIKTQIRMCVYLLGLIGYMKYNKYILQINIRIIQQQKVVCFRYLDQPWLYPRPYICCCSKQNKTKLDYDLLSLCILYQSICKLFSVHFLFKLFFCQINIPHAFLYCHCVFDSKVIWFKKEKILLSLTFFFGGGGI